MFCEATTEAAPPAGTQPLTSVGRERSAGLKSDLAAIASCSDLGFTLGLLVFQGTHLAPSSQGYLRSENICSRNLPVRLPFILYCTEASQTTKGITSKKRVSVVSMAGSLGDRMDTGSGLGAVALISRVAAG